MFQVFVIILIDAVFLPLSVPPVSHRMVFFDKNLAVPVNIPIHCVNLHEEQKTYLTGQAVGVGHEACNDVE